MGPSRSGRRPSWSNSPRAAASPASKAGGAPPRRGSPCARATPSGRAPSSTPPRPRWRRSEPSPASCSEPAAPEPGLSLFCATPDESLDRSVNRFAAAHGSAMVLPRARWARLAVRWTARRRSSLRPAGRWGVTRVFFEGRRILQGGLIFLLIGARSLDASAETIDSALARAYAGNPTLNSTRASVRATDENVPRALSGYRPRVTGTADAGIQYNETHTPETTRTNRGGDITISAGSTTIRQGRVTHSP